MGFLNDPQLPLTPDEINDRVRSVILKLLAGTHQQSVLMAAPKLRELMSVRPGDAASPTAVV